MERRPGVRVPPSVLPIIVPSISLKKKTFINFIAEYKKTTFLEKNNITLLFFDMHIFLFLFYILFFILYFYFYFYLLEAHTSTQT